MMPRVLAKAPGRRGDLLAGAGVLAVALLLLHEVALEGRVLFYRDVHLVWHSEIAALRTSPRAIERLAREQLGLARPDETVFLIREEDASGRR